MAEKGNNPALVTRKPSFKAQIPLLNGKSHITVSFRVLICRHRTDKTFPSVSQSR